MPIASALFALALSASHGQPAPPPSDDEARIEALVAAEAAFREANVERAREEREEAQELERESQEGQFPPARGTRIAFEDLGKMKDRGVRVRTTSGRTHTGLVQEVDKNELHLRARLRGGYAEFTLARKQIAEIQAE